MVQIEISDLITDLSHKINQTISKFEIEKYISGTWNKRKMLNHSTRTYTIIVIIIVLYLEYIKFLSKGFECRSLINLFSESSSSSHGDG